mmetsp:Transcript_1387/g.3752  ORF Transcript_1387/g.3752 Transcript_1387/m.3752 type:complete len:218 (+) Transcript_1387:192-845(+)
MGVVSTSPASARASWGDCDFCKSALSSSLHGCFSSLMRKRGPVIEMMTAPIGAVHTIARTAMARTSLPRSSSSSLVASSRAIAPTAACTVAFGIHANAVKSRSCHRKPFPITARYVTKQRTTKLHASMHTPYATVSPFNESTETAAPTRPKSRGCATFVHASPKLAATGLEADGPQLWATTPEQTRTANAEAPEKSAFFKPKEAVRAANKSSVARSR